MVLKNVTNSIELIRLKENILVQSHSISKRNFNVFSLKLLMSFIITQYHVLQIVCESIFLIFNTYFKIITILQCEITVLFKIWQHGYLTSSYK